MSRADWDREYAKILEEAEDEDRKQLITSAAIAGRLSLILEAERAFSEGLEFEQFIQIMQYIISQEVITGTVDASTFKISENLTDSDDGLPGI
jgi:hypothetical protein